MVEDLASMHKVMRFYTGLIKSKNHFFKSIFFSLYFQAQLELSSLINIAAVAKACITILNIFIWPLQNE